MTAPITSYLPFLLSLLLGYLFIECLCKKTAKINFYVHIFLAGGLGLGFSAYISFLSFISFNCLNKPLVISIHIILLLTFFLYKFCPIHKPDLHLHLDHLPDIKAPVLFLFLFSAMIPIWHQANFYPFGGWDAWAVWNFKAKFLFLAGKEWTNIFDPILWRSSPHYPLLLPLINVWGWVFTNNPIFKTTSLLTSIIFTFLTAGLLFSGLKDLTKSSFSILAPLLLLTLPFYGTLATSQYCDIVLSYFLLASLFCLREGIHGETAKSNGHVFALLSGLFLGCLSFTKPEGLVAAVFIGGLGLFYFNKDRDSKKSRNLFFFGLLISFLPTIIFKLLYSPGNQTFINGLLSQDKPATFVRLQTIFIFIFYELKSPKWNWMWGLMLLGLILSKGGCFNKKSESSLSFLLPT